MVSCAALYSQSNTDGIRSEQAAATDKPTREYIATSVTMDPPTSGRTRVIAMRISSRPKQ